MRAGRWQTWREGGFWAARGPQVAAARLGHVPCIGPPPTHAHRKVLVRRRRRSQVRLRHRPLGNRRNARRPLPRAPARSPGLSLGLPELTFGPLATAAHECGHLRVCRQRAVCSRLLLEPAAARRHGCLPIDSSNFHFWGWQADHRVGCADAAVRHHARSRSTPELEWPIDLAIAVVWIAFAINFFGTIARRSEQPPLRRHLVLHRDHHHGGDPPSSSTTWSIPVWAAQELLDLRRRAGRFRAVVVRPQRGRLLPDDPRAWASCTTSCPRPRGARSTPTGSASSTSGRWSSSTSGRARTTCSTRRSPEWAQTLGMISRPDAAGRPRWGGMLNGFLTPARRLEPAVAKTRCSSSSSAGVTFYGMATFERPVLSIKSVNALPALHRSGPSATCTPARSAGTAS